MSEWAVGTIYNNYEYATISGGKLVTIKIVLAEVQCANYDDPKKTACEQERKKFNPDDVIGKIVGSFKFVSK
ncbi:hypothetical protein HGA64_03090 [Candidatus Falkowbacteria bacterium]|nr:hypothetical protein [Candidatus Falkowbacteria bacterium]